MRTLNPSLALASLVGFLTAASCTLITDVDRTKIPTDAGAEAGAPGTGGTPESGGTAGNGGMATGGTTGGSAGTGGEGGQNPTGGTGGNAGESGAGTGATGGTSGTGGAAGGGSTTAVCTHATGTITLAPMTFFSDKDTFSIGDGINPTVVFEFDLNSDGVTSGHVAIAFDGTENQFGLAGLITAAINGQRTAGNLLVKPTFVEAPTNNGGGEGGAAGAAGSGAGGDNSAGAAPAPMVDPATDTAHINLTNDLAGARGNVTIRRSKSSSIGQGVGNGNFKVTGMSGGEAVACASAASCTTDDECASTQCGSDSKCVAP